MPVTINFPTVAEKTAPKFVLNPLETCRGDKNWIVQTGQEGKKRARKDHNSFVAAAVYAFDAHLGFMFKPDDVWQLIIQAVCLEIETNAEELRGKLVTHQGKAKLIVDRDDFVLDSKTNDWASVVREFADKIKDHTVDGVSGLLESNFSTTTVLDRTVVATTVMCAMKNYFEYVARTMCGFPRIVLDGTAEDWTEMRYKVSSLLSLCTVGFAKRFGDALSVFFNHVDSAFKTNGKADSFWQQMVHYHAERASGATNKITGWINMFFPYIFKSGEIVPNEACVPNNYTLRVPEGAYPNSTVTCDGVWEYFDTKYPLIFETGIFDYMYDHENKAVVLTRDYAVLRGEEPVA